MSETDPFTDAVFTGRLQKLLPMLGSEQPGEADAARRKIAEHLASHRLSFTDLAQHLRDRAPSSGPSFTRGAREISLERQLAIARSAKEEAAQEAESALNRVRALEIELQQVTFEIGRTLNAQARIRIAAAVACAVAAACLIITVLPRGPFATTAHAPPNNAQSATPTQDRTAESAIRLAPGEQLGHAAVQDLEVKLGPSDQAGTRAFLIYGQPVVIPEQRGVRIGPQTWLQIRSDSGNGWVRAGDVLR